MGTGQALRRARRMVAVCAALALIAGCSSSSPPASKGDPSSGSAVAGTDPPSSATDGSTPATDATKPAAFDVSLVPAAPAPFDASAITDPVVLGETLAKAVDATAEMDSLAAWIAAYDTLRIPVLDPSGIAVGTTGDDPIGPGFWQLWMAGGLRRAGAGMPLTDVARLLTDDASGASEMATSMLADLSAGAVAGAPPLEAFLTSFVTARSAIGKHPIDLSVAELDPAQVILDTATAQMVAWLALRGAAVSAGDNSAATTQSLRHLLRQLPSVRRDIQPTVCSQLWGSEQTTYWLNWIANKIGSGVEIAGVGQFKSIFEQWAKLAPHESDIGARVTKVAAKINVATTVLTLAMQVNALSLGGTVSPTPLLRTHTTTPGGVAEHRVDIYIDESFLPDGNHHSACAISFILNAAGISFSFPTAGGVAKAEVTVVGTDGFAQGAETGGLAELLNGDPRKNFSRKMTTDDTGSIFFSVRGKAQRHNIPDSAPPWPRSYTLSISSQASEVGGNNMIAVFFDGLTVTGAAGAITGAVDIAQAISWDLGEVTNDVTDWYSGFSADEVTPAVTITGRLCDATLPYTIHLEGTNPPLTGDFVVDPSGQATFNGVLSVPGLTSTLTGTGTWTTAPDPSGSGLVLSFQMGEVTGSNIGGSLTLPFPGSTGPYPLRPIDGDCPANS